MNIFDHIRRCKCRRRRRSVEIITLDELRLRLARVRAGIEAEMYRALQVIDDLYCENLELQIYLAEGGQLL